MAVTGILGKKIGMTQVFDEKGDVHPITVLQAGPCVITQLKTLAKDGYDAAQIGLVEFVKESKVTKAQRGHFAKSGAAPVRWIKEVPVETAAEAKAEAKRSADAAAAGETEDDAQAKSEGKAGLKAGDRVLVDIFSDEKYVDIVGTSKGRGFAGVVRRHRFAGGPKSHGHMFQVQGSIGASSFPSRVFPGQRMPGHYGTDTVTVRNLRIRGIDLEENLLMVEGAVPGARDGYVLVSKAKSPPRERRGFAGAGTVDPLKASKKAMAGKKK
jgi:large subunit ribosomal protein L3